METTKEKHATHTPGPWHVRLGEDYYHVHGEVQVALVENSPVEPPRGNARLIASAPEMYQLLRKISNSDLGDVETAIQITLDARELLAKVDGGEG